MYLPIAAEAEAASRAITPLPAGAQTGGLETAVTPDIPENLPAQVQPSGEVEPHDGRGTPLIPSIPDATKAAARWIRPLVPPFVARVIDTTTQPLRTARQVFEEVEEIAFSFKRTHKVTVDSESSDVVGQRPHRSAAAETPSPTGGFIKSSREDRDQRTNQQVGSHEQYSSLQRRAAKHAAGLSLGSAERDSTPELTKRDGPPELPSSEGPRELPPAK